MSTVDVTAPPVAGRLSRCVRAELRKVRTTRGTRWTLILTAAIWVIVGVGISAISVIVDAHEVSIDGALLGMGSAVTVFVPILAILIIAGDWQTRDVMTVFALEPRRDIVFAAKAITAAVVCLALTAAAIVLALVLTTGLAVTTGTAVAWDLDGASAGLLGWGAAVGTISGIAYGAALQRAPLAIVFSLVQGFVIDPLLALVPDGAGQWFRLSVITDAGSTGEHIAPAVVAGVLWLAIPLTIGVVRNRTADVQ